MKSLISTLLIVTMTASSLTISQATAKRLLFNPSSEDAAQKILAALQATSSEEYVALYPTLEEFHQMMINNAHVYGEYLNDAKRDFADNYVADQLPELRESFDELINKGIQIGIEWKSIQYLGIELDQQETPDLKPVPFTVVFLSNGKRYRLCIEKAFVLNGQWRVSSELALL